MKVEFQDVTPIAAAAIAFLLRTLNAAAAFSEGLPVIGPFDDLYHWKRIVFSATHFPSVLEFDPERGFRGAFCLWPPLYDLTAGGIARLFGATNAIDVLSIVVWIPPLFSAIATGIVVFILARRSMIAATLAGIGLASLPYLVHASSIGDIDHHFLEPFLVIAIAAAAVRKSAPLLAIAITCALLVQSAMIVAAGLAFVGLFFAPLDKGGRFLMSAAFATSALVIAIYRLTRHTGYPDTAWFLGWTHVTLLLVAAIALAALAILDKRPFALLIALAALALAPHASHGFQFLGGGDAYLDSVQEMQPIWKPVRDLGNYLPPIIGGMIAAPILIWRRMRERSGEAIFAIMTAGYILSTLPRRRFVAIAGALSIIVVALLITELKRRTAVIALGLTIALLPPLQLALWSRHRPPSELVGPETPYFLSAASFLRDRTPGALVLAPWSYGPMLNVIGKQRVVLDNFGSMADPPTFRDAHAVLTSPDERDVARFCDRNGIRYLVLGPPAGILDAYAKYAGRDPRAFNEEQTWYWRMYYGGPAQTRQFRGIAKFGTVIVLERSTT